MSTDGMQKNADQEAPIDDLLPAGMESDRITISGGAPNQTNAPFLITHQVLLITHQVLRTRGNVFKLDMSDPFQQCPASLTKSSGSSPMQGDLRQDDRRVVQWFHRFNIGSQLQYRLGEVPRLSGIINRCIRANHGIGEHHRSPVCRRYQHHIRCCHGKKYPT